jgi:hypothetical protein
MLKIIKDCITERDNQTYDPVRIASLLGFLDYNIVATIHVLHHCANFDFIQYATGLSIIIGMISAGVTYKYIKEV